MLRPTRTFTDIQVICKKTKENNKVSGHMMLLAQVSDYFNTFFNTRLGTFNGVTELECTVEAFTFITDSTIYITDVSTTTPEVVVPEFAAEVLKLMDVLQIRPEFQELVVKKLLDANIDFSQHPEIHSAYMEFIMQFPRLLSDTYILKHSLNSNETFLRNLFALPNIEQWYKMSDKFEPEVALKIVKEKPVTIVKLMSAMYALSPMIKILSSQVEVEMFYEYMMLYIGTNYIKHGCDYRIAYLCLIERNRQFGNNKNIENILTKLVGK